MNWLIFSRAFFLPTVFFLVPIFLVSCTTNSKPPYTITIGDPDAFRQKKSDKPRKPYSWSLQRTRTAKVKLKETGIEFICQNCEFGQAYILKPGETIKSALADLNRNPNRIEFPAKLYTSKFIKKSGNIMNINAKSIFLKYNPSTKSSDIEKIQSFVTNHCPNNICKLGIFWKSFHGVNETNMHYLEKVTSNKLTIIAPYGKEQLLITLNEISSIDMFRGNLAYQRVMNAKDIKTTKEVYKIGQDLTKSDILNKILKNLNEKSGHETIPVYQLRQLMKEGNHLLNNKKYSAALEKFKEHLRVTKEFNAKNVGVTLDVTEVWSNIMIARTYNKMKKYSSTIKLLTPVYDKIKVKFSYNFVIFNALRKALADAHFESNNYVLANKLYKEAFIASSSLTDKDFNKKNPQFGFASQYRKDLLEKIGRTLEKQKKYAEAAKSFLNGRKEIWTSLIPKLTSISPGEKTYILETSTSGESLVYPFVFENKDVPAVYGLDESLLSNKLHFESNRFDKYRLPPALNSELTDLYHKRLSVRQEISRLSILLKNNKSVISNTEKRNLDYRISTLAGKLRKIDIDIDAKTVSRKQYTLLQHMTSKDVIAGLRSTDTIIQYIKYKKYNSDTGKSTGKPFYGALVTQGRTKKTRAFNIAPAQAVEESIDDYRKSVIETALTKDEASLKLKGKKLKELLLGSIINSNILVNSKRIYIVPDGHISLLSFESLPSQIENRYLVQDFEIVYLMTARDIPFYRQQANLENPDQVWFIGDPDFQMRNTSLNLHQFKSILNKPVPLLKKYNTRPNIRSNWDRLDSTGRSVTTMKNLLTEKKLSYRILIGPEATESNVLNLKPPESLIFTTHGNFDTSRKLSHVPTTLIMPLKGEGNLRMTVSAKTDPLHDSMLILAGANNRNHQMLDDGLLTAYEVWAMDLRNTDFVALIGCETGLSSKFSQKGLGDNLGGLREAFFVAGARSLLMSLWEVPVNTTMKQFEDFFRKNQDKTISRYESFHAAQLSALERARSIKKSTHPIWWGGFVYIGDPGDLPVNKATE